MTYTLEAPSDPRERLAYLAERAALLVAVEEKAEQLACLQAGQPYSGPGEAVRTAREAAESVRELAELHAEPEPGNPLDAEELQEALRTAENLVAELHRLGGAEEEPSA